jgi:hypothetical protein
LNAKHDASKTWLAWIGVRRGIRMPTMMIHELLLTISIAGMGLSVAYLRAEYVLYRGFKAAEQEKSIVQCELYADWLKTGPSSVSVATTNPKVRVESAETELPSAVGFESRGIRVSDVITQGACMT